MFGYKKYKRKKNYYFLNYFLLNIIYIKGKNSKIKEE